MLTNIKILTIHLMLNILISGCVGTIKSTAPINTKAQVSNDKTIGQYPGIIEAVAISNNRAEIIFPPNEGDSDQIAYVIRYDGQQIPTYVFGSGIKPDYRGFLKYTVTNLQADTTYSFSVQVRNVKNNIESSNNSLRNIKTYNNATAIFNGISIVRNLSGADGLNGIEAIWPEAEIRGGVVSKDEIDPIEYQVTIIDSNFLNPGDMNNIVYTEPNRKVFSIQGSKRSAIINGLKSGTKYFVQVRATHYGYSFPYNSSNKNYKKEANTNYLEITTYSENVGNLNFDNNSLKTSFPAGNAGLYSINLNWQVPEGNFDHYRIFYSIDGKTNLSNFLNTGNFDNSCTGIETDDVNIRCQFANSNVNNFLLTGLETNTKFNLAVAVCLTRSCESGKRIISNLKLHTTTPEVANFRGITSISLAKDLTKLDRMYLNFESPDFNSGNIAGFNVEYYGADTNNPSPIIINDLEIINPTQLDVQPFDYRLDKIIEISGINPSSSTPYCFLIIPFTYNNDGSKTTHRVGLIPQCKIPQIKGPTILDFPGVDAFVCKLQSKEIEINWSTPNVGIYSHFEIFYTSENIPFNFGDAFSWDDPLSPYNRILVDSSKTKFSLSNLQPGKSYKVGILSFYDSINGIIRSENNLNIVHCN